MRKHLLAAACAAAFTVSGCQSASSPSPTYQTSSGTLALSSDDALLYAVDTDNGTVAVVDTLARAKVAEVRVGRLPGRVVVAPDDTLYVANRGDRSVSVIRRGSWQEAARISVGVEPSGLAVSPDGRTLYVVNATTLSDARVGSLQAVDTQSLQTLWEVPVGEEPRGLALMPDGRAAVGLSKQGQVVMVDLQARRVVSQPGDALFERANESALLQQGLAKGSDRAKLAPATFRPRGMNDLVGSPDGERVYATASWMSNAVLGGDTAQTGSGASYGSSGPCTTGGVVSAGVVTFEASGEARTDDVSSCFNGQESQRDFPPTLITVPKDREPVQGPTVGVVDPTGSWLFVVNRESNNVAVVPTSRSARPAAAFSGGSRLSGSVHTVVPVGAAPDGIALTRDGRTAYVYSQFDHTLHTLSGTGGSVRAQAEPLQLAQDVLSADAAAGRKLFFSAVDSRMNAPNVAVSCASCHPDAREDGHVWNFTEGPRQTPSLAGRKVTETGPFHWSGEFKSMNDFMGHTVSARMGGTGATPAMQAQLAAYMESAPVPDNPHRGEQLTAQQLRGKEVFEQAECGTCHTGAAFTNNTFRDVGTLVRTGPVVDDLVKLRDGLNTPSLLSLSRTAPFLHDGSVPDFKARILQNKDMNLHGQTSRLSAEDVDALVAYLQYL